MYSTVEALLRLLPEAEILQLADDDRIGVLADPAVTAVLAEMIDQADREIDAYVGVVESVPMDPPPALLVNISTKLAVHNLYLRRAGIDEPETWQRETSRCMRMLEMISTGKIALGAQDGAVVDPDTSEILVSTSTRIFDQKKWGLF